ncbi:MAG: PH domain-containing protein [Haloarculaceae archaeon]
MKLHPLSAVTRALQRGVLAASTAFFVFAMLRLAAGGDVPFAVLVGLVVAFAVAGAAYQVAYYFRFAYELSADSFDIDSGVLARREREIPFTRVQNVDVTESLVHRLLGVAVVKVETAGGAQTEAELNYVSAAEARRIQQEIRERRAAVRDRERADAAASDGVEGDTADAVDVTGSATGTAAGSDVVSPIFALDAGELVVLSLSSYRARSIVLLLVGLPFVQDAVARLVRSVTGGSLDPAALADTPDLAFLAGLAVLAFGIVTAWVLSAIVTFVRYYGFRLGRQGRDLVYERGLLQRYSGSIPREKVQTIAITETLPMRLLGYAGLEVETAGYGPGQRDQGGSQSAIPIARRDRTLSLARALEAFGEPSFRRPPKRARRRYAVRYLLAIGAVTAALGFGALWLGDFQLWVAPLVLVPVAPLAAHLKWKHRGYHAGADHLVVRSGFWNRTTRVVPYYRLQTVLRSRSLFQRRLDLAHVTADTATSSLLGRRDATAYDVDAADARRLYARSRERLQASLGGRP